LVGCNGPVHVGDACHRPAGSRSAYAENLFENRAIPTPTKRGFPGWQKSMQTVLGQVRASADFLPSARGYADTPPLDTWVNASIIMELWKR
jgi:hypothetical protein